MEAPRHRAAPVRFRRRRSGRATTGHLIDPQRELFGIPAEVAYFNCASLAPLMRPAREAGNAALERRGEPWRISSGDWFDRTEERRTLFSRLVGVSPENVALIPASSYGLATAARNLTARPGQRVLIVAEDFPSNVYTWRAFCDEHGCELFTVDRAPGQDWTEAVLAALDERVAIAAVPNVHWTDGSFLDLAVIAERLRAHDARLVVDASQSLGAMPFDFATVRPDFLVAVGYKWLLGPLGQSYLYVADRWLDGRPLEENWISREGSDDFAALVDYTEAYPAGARRFDVGQRTNFETTPVSIAVLERLLGWGVEAVATTLAAKTERIARAAVEMGLELSSPIDWTAAAKAASGRPRHMLGIQLPKASLATAPGLLKQSGVYVAVRGSSVRISPHVYNDDGDIERLLQALRRLVP